MAGCAARRRRLSTGSRCARSSRPPTRPCGPARSISTNPRPPKSPPTCVPIPDSHFSVDQFQPFTVNPYQPLTGAFPADHARTICTSAITSANCAATAPSKPPPSPSRSRPTWSAPCSSACAAPLSDPAGQGRAGAGQGQPGYFDRELAIGRDRLSAGDIAQLDLNRLRVAARAVRIRLPDRAGQSAHRQNPTAAIAERPHAGGPVRRHRPVRFLRPDHAARRVPQPWRWMPGPI